MITTSRGSKRICRVITVKQAMARWRVNREEDNLQEMASSGGMGRVRDDGVFVELVLVSRDHAVGCVRTGDQSFKGDGGDSGRNLHHGTR